MTSLARFITLAVAAVSLAGCVVYPASYYGPPARYGYYAPPPPPPVWYGGPRGWR